VGKEKEKRVRSVLILVLFSFARLALAHNRDGDLLKQAQEIFGPLPQVVFSEHNPVTPAKATLGKALFYETRISVDGTVSCVRCHPFSLYGADGLRKSIGHDAQRNPRNAPTVLNAAGQISAHWIGNRKDVEDQAKQSVLGPASFGMPSYEAVERILRDIPGYESLFRRAFPREKEPVNIENFAKAVGAFERTLVTPSPFDAFMNGDQTALTDLQKTGLKTFIETGCVICHAGAYVGGQMYEKFGVLEPYWRYTKSPEMEEGRYAVTKNEGDKYVFKVPGLRNVEMTSPYFHDGSVVPLSEAVRIMGQLQLGKILGGQQVEEIIVFLKSLTGRIPEEALRVPLLPPGERALGLTKQAASGDPET
jgi:cytochrome c peroxidase